MQVFFANPAFLPFYLKNRPTVYSPAGLLIVNVVVCI